MRRDLSLRLMAKSMESAMNVIGLCQGQSLAIFAMIPLMARKLSEHSFSRGKRTAYPWKDWLDGNCWELEHGKDFDVAPYTLRAMTYVAARRANKKVRTELHKTKIIIQAYE